MSRAIGKRRKSYLKKFWVWLALVVIGSVVSVIGPLPSSAQAAEGDPLTVSVTIDRITAIDDFGGLLGEAADFYTWIRIDGDEARSGIALDDDDVALDFTHSVEVAADAEEVSIRISVSDDDGLAGFEHADISPGNNSFLSFDVDPQTCELSAPINNICAAEIVREGDGNGDEETERARITFRVEVDGGPGIDELNVICSHESIWPQNGDTTEITARSTNDQLLPRFADKVEIWFNGTTSPVVTESSRSRATFTTLPLSVGTFSYGCRITKDGEHLFSGWRTVQVGSPTDERPVASIVTGAPDDSIDILFVADSTSFSAGPSDPNFLSAVETVVLKGIYGRAEYLDHQNEINIWLARDVGGVAPGSGICPNFTQPAGIDSDYRFAESVAFIHTQDLRDCAPGRSISVKAGAGLPENIFLHELGHAAFGLADEYSGDGGYFMSRVFPNLFFSAAQCVRDAPGMGRTTANCRPVRQDADKGGRTFFTHDPASNDVMVDNGQIRALDKRAIDGTFARFPNGLPGPRSAGASPPAEPIPGIELHRDQLSMFASFALAVDGGAELSGVEQFAGVSPRYLNPPDELVVRTYNESGLLDAQWMADPRRVHVYEGDEIQHGTNRQDGQLLVPLDPDTDELTLTVAESQSGDILIEQTLVRSDLALSIVDVNLPSYVPQGSTAIATATIEVENRGPNGPGTGAVKLTSGGGAGLTTTSGGRVNLGAGETDQIDVKFPVSCKGDELIPATSLVAQIDSIDVIDPNLANNIADLEGSFECIDKTPINIALTRPEGEREVVDDSVELAIMGTPELDVSAIDPASLRFGSWDAVSRGRGAEPSASPYNEDTWSDDAEEPDGFEDLVATFALSDSGLLAGDNRACVVFRARVDGQWYSYFGCDGFESPEESF